MTLFALIEKSAQWLVKMNRYLKRGLIFFVLGVLMCYYGLYSKDSVASFYKLLLILGVISFGYGFVMIIYSLMRKIERRSIEEERSHQSSEKDQKAEIE